jgi:hypothetical protein
MSAPSPVRVNPLYLGSYLMARVQGSAAATESPADPEALQEEIGQSLQSSGTKVDSSVDPCALPIANSEPDVQKALRERLPLALAGGALHTELVVAALNHPASELPTVEALEAYQVQASQWIEATTRMLAGAWQGSGAGEVDDDAPFGRGQIPDDHRYEITRLLAQVLRDHPDAPTQIEPARMAMYLTVPESAHRSLHPDSGMRLAEARALVYVLIAALRCDFQREVSTVLNDAWTAVAETAERQAQPLDQALDLTPDAWQRALRHLLDTTGALYAATLAWVHRNSVQMIQAYQDRLNAGDSAGADRLAQAYQDRRLGYAGIPHYFQMAVEPIHRWVRVALSEEATVREATPTVLETSPGPPSPRRNRSTSSHHRGSTP